jgi:hypothetical protein
MAKNVKQTKTAPKIFKDKKLQRYVIIIPTLAFLIKMIVMSNIPSGGWLGADGENYTSAIDGLLKDGFFSDAHNLSYWPAGYSLLLWALAAISAAKFYYLVSFVQSLFFAYATYYFGQQLRVTKFQYLTFLSILIISFNPTLSLGTLAIGYEAPVAACFMMILGLTIKYMEAEKNKRYWIGMSSAAAWFGLAIFMQPRFLLVAALYFVYLAFKIGKKRSAAMLIVVSALVVSISPAIMIFRNIQVTDQATISTNLGVTMAIGAGDETAGGYDRKGPEVPCRPKSPATEVTDNEKVQCVIKWYLSNPIKTMKLAYNKSQFFWSPWSGPLVNGTMARNPWLKISPTQGIGKTADGAKLVNSGFGKFVSCLWIIGQIFFLIWGYRSLRKLGDSERMIANLVLLPIVISWLISIGTIGDHRFRIPTMTLSLFLQVAGFMAIKNKLTKAL